MPIKYTKLIALFVVLVNITTVLFAFRYFGLYPEDNRRSPTSSFTKSPLKVEKSLEKLVTVIIREFELSENDVSLTVKSVLKVLPNVNIYVLFNDYPYPPLDLILNKTNTENIKTRKLSPSLKTEYSTSFISEITTKYVMIVPDSTRLVSKQPIYYILNKLQNNPDRLYASPVPINEALDCLKANVNIKGWAVNYESVKDACCNIISGKHILFLNTDMLKALSDPFLLPFPHSLYLQTAAMNKLVEIVNIGPFKEGKPVMKSHHAHWKLKQLNHQRLKELYKLFKIKQVSTNGKIGWYGCNKNTTRCFPPVINSMPSYLYENKWTPPCCLSNLKKTAIHVIEILENSGLRFWLEAGSLLGAMRSGDILPWDHDVDIGFIKDDVNRCEWLKKAEAKSVTDHEGYLWEKATEGNFFRVYFSKINKIHVNLFPFDIRNGTVIKDSWYSGNRKTDFPENFLHPMSSIQFIGRHVPSPNNIRDFLELKFGKACIENPEYPDASQIKFI